jgi:membrane protease YdiL (CAAX protease family)
LNARALFVTNDGRLRPLWRILFFVAASFAALYVADVILGPLVTQFFLLVGIQGVSNEYWVQAIGILGGTAIALRVIDKRPWRDVWLGSDAARPSLLVTGFLIGAAAIAVPIAGLIGVHWLRPSAGGVGSWPGAALRVSLTLLPAALFEELVARGYVLSVLRDSWGWTWAIVATSVGFGLLHLGNNGVTAESVALVMLAGFFLAGVLYATRSLYAAWMAHFAWNWTMAVVFHTAVSGYPLEAPGYRYVDAGPDWATGGEWGPEGGVPAGFGMVAGAGLVYLLSRRRRDGAAKGRAPETQVAE